MTFVFLGIDGMDIDLAREFDVTHEDRDTPVHLERLEQDMPEVLAEEDGGWDPLGWWTFYLWGAIAHGGIRTPQMEITHPTPDDLGYPHADDYFEDGRPLRSDADDPFFAWDEFEDVKVINWPLCLPEYCRNADLFRNDAIATDYGDAEALMLLMEINDAIERNYDAVFACTRIVDTHQHAATEPPNYNASGYDQFTRGFADRDFDDLHDLFPAAQEYVDEAPALDEEMRGAKDGVVDAVLNWLSGLYRQADDLMAGINWDGVEDHIILSDHGFDRLGAGDVRSHGPGAVMSSSLGEWEKMSEFIRGWRPAMRSAAARHDDVDTIEVSQERQVQRRLRELGYQV